LPRFSEIGLRKVADVAAIDRVFDELATPNTDPQLDWKVRHRENADRMTGGGLFGTVEVLKACTRYLACARCRRRSASCTTTRATSWSARSRPR